MLLDSYLDTDALELLECRFDVVYKDGNPPYIRKRVANLCAAILKEANQKACNPYTLLLESLESYTGLEKLSFSNRTAVVRMTGGSTIAVAQPGDFLIPVGVGTTYFCLEAQADRVYLASPVSKGYIAADTGIDGLTLDTKTTYLV